MKIEDLMFEVEDLTLGAGWGQVWVRFRPQVWVRFKVRVVRVVRVRVSCGVG